MPGGELVPDPSGTGHGMTLKTAEKRRAAGGLYKIPPDAEKPRKIP